MAELALRVWTRDEIRVLAQRVRMDIIRAHGACGSCRKCRLADARMTSAIAAACGPDGNSHRRAAAGPD